MKGFVLIPKKLGELNTKNRYIDIAVYFVIRSYYCNGKAAIGYKKIQEKLGISNRDIIKAINDLKEEKLLTYKYVNSDNNDYVFNEYTFNKDYDRCFEMVGTSLIGQNLKAKQIGLLIYLKLNSISGWYYYKDYTDLASKLGCTRQTASKTIKDLEAFIRPSKAGGIQFINKIFTFKETAEKPQYIITL